MTHPTKQERCPKCNAATSVQRPGGCSYCVPDSLTSKKEAPLLDRLRWHPRNEEHEGEWLAADEIERLRAALEEAACVLDSEAPVAAQRVRKALSGNSSAPETKALQVPAAHRAGTEPLSRLAGDVEWCMAKINPDSDVYAVLHGVQVALRGAEQEAAKDDECCCAEAGGGLVCTLPKNHAGRHEAWGTRKNLLQAWSAQETSRNAVPWNPETSSAVPIHQQSPQKATRDPPGSYRDATGELVLPQVPARCINYPCQLRAGHTGPCDSFPNGSAESGKP